MSTRPPDGDHRMNASTVAGWGVFLVLIAVGLGVLVLSRGLDSDPPAAGNGTTATTKKPSGTTTTTAAQATTTTSTIPPDAIQVLVANGAGVSGAAGKITDQLKALGYRTLTPVNADKSTYPTSLVYYIESQQDAAKQVAAALDVAKTELLPVPAPVKGGSAGDADVVVIVGTDLATGGSGGSGTTTTTAETTTTT